MLRHGMKGTLMQWMPDVYKLSHGDQKEWQRLSIQYRQHLIAHAYRIVRNMEDAEEVVQIVLMKLWIRRAQCPAIRNIEHYLLRSVRNQARNLVRPTLSRLAKTDDEAALQNFQASRNDNPVIRLERREQSTLLSQLETRLTQVQQKVFAQLQMEPDLSGRRTAQKLGCSHKNVQGIIRRIRDLFTAHWTDL